MRINYPRILEKDASFHKDPQMRVLARLIQWHHDEHSTREEVIEKSTRLLKEINQLVTISQLTSLPEVGVRWMRGANTPVTHFPSPPVFTEPCRMSAVGAWRNLGGHWVKERGT